MIRVLSRHNIHSVRRGQTALSKESYGSTLGRIVTWAKGVGASFCRAFNHVDRTIAKIVTYAEYFFRSLERKLHEPHRHFPSHVIRPNPSQTTVKKTSVLWEQFHHFQRAGGGIHGAQFLVDTSGHRIGVYKAKEGRGWTEGLRQKGIFLSSGVEDPMMVAEECSFRVAEALGFVGLIPETTVDRRDGREGSLQVYVEGFELASKGALSRLQKVESLSECEITLFQRMACFDFILGNVDRHLANWMVKQEPSGRILDICLIDNGSSFPKQHVLQATDGDIVRSYVARNQYNWATFGVAEFGFTPSIKEFIARLSEDKMEEVLNSLEEDFPGYLSQEMRDYTTQRFLLLKEAAAGRVRVSVDGEEIRDFCLRDLFVFLDQWQSEVVVPLDPKRRQQPPSNEAHCVFWTPALIHLFQINNAYNTPKG